MDARSETNLQEVHPDLIRIVRATVQSPQPFIVICGLRTLTAQQAALACGNSTTMHSRHLADTLDGLSRAVDLAALLDGKVSFAPGHEAEVFGAIALQVKTSAYHLNLPIEWGGDWKSFKDWGHFQLPWASYP